MGLVYTSALDLLGINFLAALSSVQAFLPVRLLRKAYRTTEQPLPPLSWQLDGLELNKTALDTVEAKKLAQRLREVTGQTDHYFSQDVRVTARLLAYLLAFESHQQGFGLTATQDAHFNEVSCALCPLLRGPDPPVPQLLLPSLLVRGPPSYYPSPPLEK